MKTAGNRPFLVIGENIHATRTLARTGRHIVQDETGQSGVAFESLAGEACVMPLAEPIARGSDFAAGKVKHVRNAVLLGMANDGLVGAELASPPSQEAAALARAYLLHLAIKQIRTGADWLDVNVDQVGGDLGVRMAAMSWTVRVLEEAIQVSVPLSLDSSSTDVLAAGLGASHRPHGPLLLNSASLERVEVLDLAAREECAVVIGAAGERTLPSDTATRVANTERILALAADRGIALDRCHLDPLVMPAGVDPDAGEAYLAAARQIRTHYGPDLHITGGLSNVSFGLPGRRLLNDVFIALAMDAGVDSGIIDPVGADFSRIFGYDRDEIAFRLAADLLEGRDAYGMEFLAAFRAGDFAAALA